ncbi:MAG: SIMPL domain-containing protein [Candidatus Diapherotrites archaeon]|nr:SIMPL domain-containing protein [Candidatus Diapherotrites archaeon]
MSKDSCDSKDGCCKMKTFGFAVIVLLAAVLLVGAFWVGASYSKDQNINVSTNGSLINEKLLSVSGSVVKMVSPDRVDIVLSIETLDKSAQKSQTDNAALADSVRKALSSVGVLNSEVKTVSYSENEEFKWDTVSNESHSTGFRTVNEIQVTLNGNKITEAGKIIDAAVNAGANRVSSISFGLSDSKELEIRKNALAEASSVAKTKAESIAGGLGISVGKIHSVSENSYYYTPNYASYDRTMSAGTSAEKVTTPISSGDVEVSASVSLTFELD